jgi:hypothetical protein
MTRNRVRLVWTAFGLALGTVAIALGLVVASRPWWSFAVVPIFGLPALWAAGAVWWFRPKPHIHYGSGKPLLLGSIGSAYALTVLIVLALVWEVVREPSGRSPSVENPLVTWAVVFFVSLGIPAGMVCLLYLIGSGLLSLWLNTEDDTPDSRE